MPLTRRRDDDEESELLEYLKARQKQKDLDALVEPFALAALVLIVLLISCVVI